MSKYSYATWLFRCLFCGLVYELKHFLVYFFLILVGVKDVCNPRFGTMLFAEVIGTFSLVFKGCGSVKL